MQMAINRSFVDDIFQPFIKAKQGLAYSKLRKDISQVVDLAKGLEEFGVAPGDVRYAELNNRAALSISDFLSNNNLYTQNQLEADIPALEYLQAMSEKPLGTVSRLEEAKEIAGKAVGMAIIVTAVLGTTAIVVLPFLVAFVNHSYHWWMHIL